MRVGVVLAFSRRETPSCGTLATAAPPVVERVMTEGPYRVVQPWGRDRGRQATVISEHVTAAAAFAEIERLTSVMVRNGAPPDAVQLVVADGNGDVVRRADAQ